MLYKYMTSRKLLLLYIDYHLSADYQILDLQNNLNLVPEIFLSLLSNI